MTTNINTNYNKYLPTLAVIFYAIVLISNSAAHKIINVYGFYISTSTIVYPLSYPLMATITELYGFKKARHIISTGAFCNIGCALYLYLIGLLPAAHFWQERFRDLTHQYNIYVSLIFITSTIAYVVSEYANSFLLSKLRILTRGRFFLFRAITSITTAIIIDALCLVPLILLNPTTAIAINVIFTLIFIKLIYEIILLPFMWLLTHTIKLKEGQLINDSQMPFSSITYVNRKQINIDTIQMNSEEI